MTVSAQPIWNNEVDADSEKDALLQFSDVSRKFIDSYTSLEKHVDRLSSELQAQTAAKEQEYEEKNHLAERLQLILSTLPSAVIVIDGHGKVQECNTLAEDMLGFPLIGERWLTIISRAFAPKSDDGFEISLKDGRRVKVETRALGKQPGQIVLLTDLTETRKQQESQSREQRLSSIGKMMASLAHQIRTPLSSALLYSGHISSQKLNGEQHQRCHNNLQHSLKQLQRQVSDMLLFASGGVASKERFQLADLIKALKADLDAYQLHKEIDINFENFINENLESETSLFGNSQALLGSIANLIENSIHACNKNLAQGKLVDIAIVFEIKNEKNLSISVSDNGCGISKSDQKHIFQPFYTKRARGTGLGLAVVNTVINSFKGAIKVESEDISSSTATTITLTLPCIHSSSSTLEQSIENISSTVEEESQLLTGGQ